MLNRIIRGVSGVSFLTEKAILKMFGVRIGTKTMYAKSLGEPKPVKLSNDRTDKMKAPIGKPGSEERIQALIHQYAICEPQGESPFHGTTEDMAAQLACVAEKYNWGFNE